MSIVLKIDSNSNIKIPNEIIKKAGLKPGTDVICYYDEAARQIIIMGKPVDFAKALRGLGKEIWKDADANAYVQEERSTWQ